MRLYIGINLPSRVKHTLFKYQLQLKKLGIKGSWKAQEYFHITLEFLGELPPESAPALIQIMKTAINNKKTFRLQIDKLGAFPSFHRPHTLWAVVGGDVEALYEIRNKMHEELGKNGFLIKEAPFRPHITLLSHPKALETDLASLLLSKTENFTVSEVILFESKVEDGRRIYPHIFCAKLKRK